MKAFVVSALAGLSFISFSLNSQAASTCSDTLAKLEKQGLSAEALYLFQKEAAKQKLLGDVAGSKTIAIVDLSRKRTENRFFVLDLKTGELKESLRTTHGVGNKADSEGRVTVIHTKYPGSKAAPAGLMKISDHSRPLVKDKSALGLDLQGLQDENRYVGRSGILIQSCRHMENYQKVHSRSWGSFCLTKSEVQGITPLVKDSYLYSVRPQDLRAKLTESQEQEVCGLFSKTQTEAQTESKASLEPNEGVSPLQAPTEEGIE